MTTTAPRPTAALLTDRTFGPYFWGSLVSNSGTWFQTITSAVVVFELTGSAVLVGMVSVLQFGASLVLSPYAGALTDRVDRRRLLLATQLLSAAAAAGLAVWTALVGVEGLPGPWPILGTALLIGVGFAFSVPAMQALVPAFVPPHDLDAAVALNSVTFNLARAVGPGLAGLTLAAFGPAVAFAVNAASYLALIVALLVVRERPVTRNRSGDGSVREGIRTVRSDGVLVLLLVGTAAVGFGADPIHTLTPPLASLLGGGERLVGWLVSAFGLGAAVTAFVTGPVRKRYDHRIISAIGLTGLALGMAALGLARSPALGMAALAGAGAGYLLAVTALTTAIQQRVDEDLRGRVMALWGVAFLGSRPIAALLDGGVADVAGPRVAAGVAAVIPLVVAAILLRKLPRSTP